MKRLHDDYTWFFRREHQAIVRTVELMLGDHEAALDVTQEAFARLYKHWRRISRYELPEAWVRRVAINLAISHMRRRRVQDATLRKLVGPSTDPEMADDRVLAAVRSLPPAQRAAIVLFYFEDQPSSQIAQSLGCSESTVRVHLHKARSKLVRMLGTVAEERVARNVDVAR